jgi:hypothetical protein
VPGKRRRPRQLVFLLGVGVGAAALRKLVKKTPLRGEFAARSTPPLFDQDAVDAPPEPAVVPEPVPEPVVPASLPAAPEPRPRPLRAAPAPSTETVIVAAPAERRRRVLPAAAVLLALALAAGAAYAIAQQPGVPRPSLAGADTVSHPVVPTGVAGITAAWVKAENAKPGTTDWRLAAGHSKDIEGFADMVSAQLGDAVGLYVSTKADSFHVDAYRMGYYGGLGGRLVWRSPRLTGRVQPKPAMEPKTRMVETEWRPSISVRITKDFPPGDYLFKLVGNDGEEQYIPLTVRDDTSTAAYVVQNSVTTWQAYNMWGGADLYAGPGKGRSATFAGRSRVASFDRPYLIGEGSGDFLGNEFPLVSLVEQQGLDVTYWTDVDLHARPDLLARHKALVSLGHDEYWSASMREGAESARDHGVNLAFLGANAAFRQIRLEDSPLGPYRREVNYKVAGEDPLRKEDPKLTTTDWRNPPVSRPENAMVGPLYECNPVKADLVVYNAEPWVFAGTDLAKGSSLPDVVGSEYDRYTPGPSSPKTLEILGHSALKCRGKPSFSDMTYYSASSGAGVFASGTNLWVPKLGLVSALDQITTNVLAAFGTGPAGRAHPSKPNTATLPAPRPGARSGVPARQQPVGRTSR